MPRRPYPGTWGATLGTLELDLIEMAREARACAKRRELEERRRLLEQGILVVDEFDIHRCPRLVLAQLWRPDIVGHRYMDDEVFLRSLFRRGVLRHLASAHGEGAKIELRLSLDLPVEPRVIPRGAAPWAPGPVRVERVVLTGVADAWLPRERELLLVYYTNSSRGLPRESHIERAAVLLLLMHANGLRADRARLLYIVGLRGYAGEYVVETRLHSSVSQRRRLLENLRLRIEGIISVDPAPRERWQCRVCPLPSIPGTGCPPSESAAEGDRGLLDGVEHRIWRDHTMKAWLTVLNEVRRRGEEWAKRRPPRRRERRLEVVTAYPGALAGCALQFWYRIYHPIQGEPPSVDSIRGSIIHSGLQAMIDLLPSECPGLAQELGVEDVRSEEPVQDVHYRGDTLYIVQGRADIIVETSSGDLVVYELKTCRDPDRCGEARPWHAQQLAIYREAIAKRTGRQVKALLYYVWAGKDGDHARITGRAVEPELDQARPLGELITQVHQAANGHLPNGAVPRYQHECRLCPYRRICPAHARAPRTRPGERKNRREDH